MFNSDPFALIITLVGLSLLPLVAMVATSYLKIVVVMSLVRNALGIQSIPPNMVLNALALMLTFYIMAPFMKESWQICSEEMAKNKAPVVSVQTPDNAGGREPWVNPVNEIQSRSAILVKAAEPFKRFLRQESSEKQVAYFVRTAERLWATRDEKGELVPANVDRDSFFILLPSFCVAELTKAFQIGFLVYLPFIAIDIIISNILLAMGMMMVSPVTISLPFKLLLFVVVNGWTLLIQGLVNCYIH